MHEEENTEEGNEKWGSGGMLQARAPCPYVGGGEESSVLQLPILESGWAVVHLASLDLAITTEDHTESTGRI